MKEFHPSIFDWFHIQREEYIKYFEAKMKCKEARSKLMIPKINWFIPPNQTEKELKESILKENFTIGKPVPGFDVYQSVCYTHNYMKKISSGPGAKALCLVCLISPEKKIVFLKCTDNSTKGKKVINFLEGNLISFIGLYIHLNSKHPEYKENITIQRQSVLKSKEEKKMRMKTIPALMH